MGDLVEMVQGDYALPKGLATTRSTDLEATDLALFVQTSDEAIDGWNRQKIVEALIREASVDREMAETISLEVQKTIMASGIATVTAPLIRELVDARLIERGMEEARKKHTRLGVPLYDAEQMIMHPNKENANVPHGPEATNLTLAENIKKEYALLNVFSPQVGEAHMRGSIHLHDLGIHRPALLLGTIPGISQAIRPESTQLVGHGKTGQTCGSPSGTHGQVCRSAAK